MKVITSQWEIPDYIRHKCKDGHNMSFIAQILLSYVPLPDMPENTLLSFHYCNECTMAGRMSWGCNDAENRGYELSIIHDIDQREPDSFRLVEPSLTKSYNIIQLIALECQTSFES